MRRFENLTKISLLGTLLVTTELLVISLGMIESASGSSLWLAFLVIYAFWLTYLGGLIRAFITYALCLLLAVIFTYTGFLVTLVFFIALIVIGELILKRDN